MEDSELVSALGWNVDRNFARFLARTFSVSWLIQAHNRQDVNKKTDSSVHTLLTFLALQPPKSTDGNQILVGCWKSNINVFASDIGSPGRMPASPRPIPFGLRNFELGDVTRANAR
jgi:hypothetical protein